MNKLQILAISAHKEIDWGNEDDTRYYKMGFKIAFQLINDLIDKEIKLVYQYPWQGERIHTLNLYKKKMNDLLKEMEEENG